MYLKRIDIIGFKSFADKTSIDFSPGITAVVGPNGSGKSNIADAIRWVLGEQSARNLRGSKMEDVIFAGSETRRSINFCEVSLTLDNSDGHLPVEYGEVTVTRRVYRSGESEYFINKQPCRLKDVTELFMDSGLGREAYSIIGQGRIEEMLSTRPEDRRGPFEDAAGIVKYKFRRREAERRLEETAGNIVRVDDILSELTLQAGPLEKEAEKARQYRQLEEELTALEIALLVRDIDELRVRWQESSASVDQCVRLRQEAGRELEVKQQSLERARAEFETKQQQAEGIQRRLLELTEARQRADGDLALLRERIDNADHTIADKTAQGVGLAEELEGLSAQFESVRARQAEVRTRLEAKSAELEAAATAADPSERARLEAEIARLNAELIEAHHTAAALRNEIKVSEESLVLDSRKRQRLESELAKWSTELERLRQSRQQLESEAAQLRSDEEQSQLSLADISTKLRERGRDEAAVVADLHRNAAECASLQSRLELLKELEEGYDGYAFGVKTVLQQADKGRLQGIHGPVASIVRVAKQYETAVETALQSALQNIVVDSEADARAAIDLLKQRQAGRATFMPLDVIKARNLPAADVGKARTVQGFVGVASDLVDCDPRYRRIVEHLLGNVVVAEKLVHANEIARKLDYRVRIVTVDGDVVSPGGVMAGGSHVRKGPGLLGRTREREDIERQIAEHVHARHQLEERQRALRDEIAQLQAEQRRLAELVASLQQRAAAVETEIREVAANEQNAADRLQASQWEMEQFEAGQEAWQQRQQQARAQLADTERRLTDIERQLAARRQELQERDEAQAHIQELLTGLRVDVATLAQEDSALGEQASDLADRRQRLSARIGQLQREITELQDQRRKWESEVTTTEQRLQEFAARLADEESALAQVRADRREAELAVAAAERAVRDQQAAVSAADERLHRAEVLAQRTDMELNHALHKMGESYHMTYEWARDHYPPVEDVDGARRSAEHLRRRMASLGEVRLGAIAEWERLSERLAFLERERSDLDSARSHLESVIAEIDDEMAKRFRHTFEQIRTEFQIAFRHLFGGGRADLSLTQPDDVLSTGIEVTAQPPGKKLQNLNLLSGGERALTAMALLFAILRVRPVPFCVLDEVEAALDEANVGRFAQQLRKFSADTQFIVITHRRGTMEEADVLYGVTMQESGISSLISVRLSDVDFETDSA